MIDEAALISIFSCEPNTSLLQNRLGL